MNELQVPRIYGGKQNDPQQRCRNAAVKHEKTSHEPYRELFPEITHVLFPCEKAHERRTRLLRTHRLGERGKLRLHRRGERTRVDAAN